MLLTATIDRLPKKTAVVTFSGPMTMGTSLRSIESTVKAVLADGVLEMVFDMARVDFVDSAGLGLIVYVHSALKEKHGKLRLCGVSAQVVSLLKLTRTDGFLHVDASKEESLAALAR